MKNPINFKTFMMIQSRWLRLYVAKYGIDELTAALEIAPKMRAMIETRYTII